MKLLVGKNTLSGVFYLKNSPTVTLSAIALFLFFTQVSIKHGKRLILTIAPCSFGVYLIHYHPDIRQLFLADRFVSLSQKPWYEMTGILLGAAVGIFVVCLAIEYLRRQLFRLLRVSKLCKAVTERTGRLIRRLETGMEAKREKEPKTP